MINILLANTDVIALFLRLFSLLISIIFIIPLAIQQARVRNGLRIFRWLLLGYGLLITVSNIVTLFVLFDIIIHSIPQKHLNTELHVANGIIYLLIALVGYAMYHYQFTPKNVKAHERFAKYEIKVADKKEKTRAKLNSDRRENTKQKNLTKATKKS